MLQPIKQACDVRLMLMFFGWSCRCSCFHIGCAGFGFAVVFSDLLLHYWFGNVFFTHRPPSFSSKKSNDMPSSNAVITNVESFFPSLPYLRYGIYSTFFRGESAPIQMSPWET